MKKKKEEKEEEEDTELKKRKRKSGLFGEGEDRGGKEIHYILL